MKKHFVIFGVLVLSLSFLTACGSVSMTAGSVNSTPAPKASADALVMPEEETITYTVEQTLQEDSALADDGTVLASCHFELPALHALRADGSEITEAKTTVEKQVLAKVADFNQKFEDWVSDANFSEIADLAREDFAQRPEWFRETGMSYDAELSFHSWQTEHLISIEATYYSYTGGAHPNSVLLAWNFDLDAGAFVEPTVIAEDGPVFLNAVAQEIIRQAEEKAAAENQDPTAAYWENYQEIIADWPSFAVSFNENGMTVGFSQYELACYAAGEQVFTLDNDFLKPYLSDYGRMVLNLPEQ